MFECEFCKHKFSSKSNMKTHIKTAKYCLKIRNKTSEIHKCEFCEKEFSKVSNLKRHERNCNYSSIVFQLRQKLKIAEDNTKHWRDKAEDYANKFSDCEQKMEEQRHDYENKLRDMLDRMNNMTIEIAKKPTTTYNTRNTINNMTIQKLELVTDEHLQEEAKNLTLGHVKRGAIGFVDFALSGPLKNRVMCVDYSRKKVKFKDDDGAVVTDPNMDKLATRFFRSVKGRNLELSLEHMNSFPDGLDETNMEEYREMMKTLLGVNVSATGEKNEFTHDFVRGVCSKTC